jgi:flagellar biosynthesis protein FliR
MLDFTNWLLVLVRVGALFTAFPFFSAMNFPVQVRLGLAGALSLLVCPALPALPLSQLSFWSLIGLLFKETSAGLILGFVCRAIFFAIEAAGAIIATEMGLALPSTFNPLTSNMTAAPTIILYWLTMMLLLSLDLHHWLIAGLRGSYEIVPPGGAHLGQSLLQEVVHRCGGIFLIALQMTAPLLAVSFLISLLFSLLSRAVPQMNVFAESFPVRVFAGLGAFGLTCHQMALHISNQLHRLPNDFTRIAQLLASGN